MVIMISLLERVSRVSDMSALYSENIQSEWISLRWPHLFFFSDSQIKAQQGPIMYSSFSVFLVTTPVPLTTLPSCQATTDVLVTFKNQLVPKLKPKKKPKNLKKKNQKKKKNSLRRPLVVKDPALSLLWPGLLLWHGFNPRPKTICMLWVQQGGGEWQNPNPNTPGKKKR